MSHKSLMAPSLLSYLLSEVAGFGQVAVVRAPVYNLGAFACKSPDKVPMIFREYFRLPVLNEEDPDDTSVEEEND